MQCEMCEGEYTGNHYCNIIYYPDPVAVCHHLEAYSINDPADMDLKVWVERKPDKLFLTCLTCWENRKNQLNGERND